MLVQTVHGIQKDMILFHKNLVGKRNNNSL